LLCVICMFLIYIEALFIAEFLFGISMVLLVLSLTLSIREILISVKALDIHLSDVEKSGKKNG
jgi:hypothetical protein